MLPSEKNHLRRRFAALRHSIPAAERAPAEAAIRDRLFALEAWREAPLICGYMATKGEPDLLPVWERAAAEGKGYALPVTVTDAKEGRMVFRCTEGYAPHGLIPARFGIPEPPDTCPTLSLADFAGALILVPGLAFDHDGYRIGYGGGYYDRFLADLRDARIPVTTVGLVFSLCRTPTLPRGEFDLPVDFILDERRATVLHAP